MLGVPAAVFNCTGHKDHSVLVSLVVFERQQSLSISNLNVVHQAGQTKPVWWVAVSANRGKLLV